MKNEVMSDNVQNCFPMGKKSGKKRKKQQIENQNDADADQASELISENASLDVPESGKVKKKHKKNRCNSNDGIEHLVVPKRNEKHCKRKLEEQNVSAGNLHKKQKIEAIEDTLEAGCDVTVVERKIKMKEDKKKRKKEKAISADTSSVTQDTSILSADNCDSAQFPKNKKKKKSKTEPETLQTVDDGVPLEKTESECLQMSCESKQKKKSKKQKLKVRFEIDVETQDIRTNMENEQNHFSINEKESTKHHKKSKKQRKQRDSSPSHETKCKVHKKKRKDKTHFVRDTEENSESALDQLDANKIKTATSPDVKTQDKRNDISHELNSSSSENVSSEHYKKKKKHSKQKDSSSEDNKKNLHNKLEFPGDIASRSHKNNDCASDQINKTTTSSDLTTTVQGQWQGNLFESSERQNKFLRLLGGMKNSSRSNKNMVQPQKALSASQTGAKKKGLFGSLASLAKTGSLGGGNAALSANEAASLNQKLEDEYNRAMNFKLSGKRGSGFGFVPDPTEGKKFHIDVNKSKSVKFDD